MYGKKIRPLGLCAITYYIISLIFLLIGVLIDINIVFHFSISYLIFSLFSSMFFYSSSLYLLGLCNYYVILKDNTIYISKQNLINKFRIQYESEILKNEIVSISKICIDYTNSLGKKCFHTARGYKYLVFNMKDGTKYKLWTEVFSEKQLKENNNFYLNK